MMVIPLIKSTFYKEEETKKKLCDFILNSKQLSFSTYCRKFEKDFSKWQNRKYCIFFNSGSSANLAIIQALLNLGKLKRGDKVGVSALTWSTNVMPIIELGLIPIPIDIEVNTLNISVAKVKKTFNEHKFKVLFITNALGLTNDIDLIKDFCVTNNIILLEDNCESMGTIYKGKKLGNFGEMSSFSTYVGHHMSTIEGGIVCTDDYEYYKMLVMVRAHGWDRNLSDAEKEEIRLKNNIKDSFYSSYTFYELGYNLRPNEINGFLGCIQLGYLDEIILKREQNFKKIIKYIDNNDNFEEIKYEHIDLVSSFSLPVICKTKKIFDKYIKIFKNFNVETRPIIGGNISNQIFWKKIYKNKYKCKNAEYVHENGFYFGNSPEYGEEEINLLINLLK